MKPGLLRNRVRGLRFRTVYPGVRVSSVNVVLVAGNHDSRLVQAARVTQPAWPYGGSAAERRAFSVSCAQRNPASSTTAG